MKKISIIILNYNGWEDTIECLNSIRNINCKDKDYCVFITVVDNFSSNESVEKISSWMKDTEEDFNIIDSDELQKASGNIKYNLICSRCNKGFSGGNNIGIVFSKDVLKVDYYLLLNNDTTVSPLFIDSMFNLIESDSLIGIVGCKIANYNNNEEYILGGYISYLKSSGYHFYNTEKASLKEISFTSGCIWLISNKTIEKCGLMDEDYFLYVEDVDYCHRVRECGLKILSTNKSVIYHKESRSTPNKPSIYYYNTRNRLYFFSKTHAGIIKTICFYIYFYASRFLIMIIKPSSRKFIIQGFRDYRNRKFGKMDLFNAK